jgi:hypothetical protein
MIEKKTTKEIRNIDLDKFPADENLEWVLVESLLKFCKNTERDPEGTLILLIRELKEKELKDD